MKSINITNYPLRQIISWLPPTAREFDERTSPESIGEDVQTFADAGCLEGRQELTDMAEELYSVRRNESSEPDEFRLETFEANMDAALITEQHFNIICAAIYDKCKEHFLKEGLKELSPIDINKLTDNDEERTLIRRVIRFEVIKRLKEWLENVSLTGQINEETIEEIKTMSGLTFKDLSHRTRNREDIEKIVEIAKSQDEQSIRTLINSFRAEDLDLLQSDVFHTAKSM